MKILFVANRMPYPPYRGDKLKIYNLAKELSLNNDLQLITIAENQEDINSVEQLFQPINAETGFEGTLTNPQRRLLFKSISWIFKPKWHSFLSTLLGLFTNRPLQVAYFRSQSFKNRLQNVLDNNQFDAIHVQHIRMAQYFETTVPTNAILDLPDAFSLYWKRRVEAASNPIEKWIRNLEYQRLVNYEKRILPKFKKVLVCSDEDRSYLNKLGIYNVDLLPNGVNINTFQPQGKDSIVTNRILFTGNMDYAPNVDAVQYFVKDIFPIILESVPNTEFVIAGQRPIKAVLELASDRVKVTGFIENLANEYAKAHVVVSPLRIGAGTQNKVLEALSMNQAVVCSNVGFQGLGITHNDGILMADNPSAFAQSVISILQSEELRKKLGETGGNHVRNTFSWTAVSNKLIEHFNSINK